jgi:hypothetical protein
LQIRRRFEPLHERATLAAAYLRFVESQDFITIREHVQFEEMLNGNFADPIDSLLRAIKPDAKLRCRVEIAATPATARRSWWAKQAVKRLDRPFFRSHEWPSPLCG